MRRVMVRYEVKPDRAAENEELVRAVYEELRRTAARRAALRDVPPGGRRQLRPRRRDRGRPNPLTEVEAFARFQEGIGDRCEETAGRDAAARGRVVRFHGDEAAADGAEPASGGPPRAPHRRPRRRQRVLRRPAALAHGADRCRLRRYHALGLGGAFGGGIVECPTRRPVWLPYVEVDRVDEVTDRAGPPRRLRAARAARGPGGLAQRRGDARGRRDRVLAAQGTARRLGGRDDRARAARRRAAAATRTPSPGSSSPIAALLDAHCYRMLGSVHDAEDAVQDALLRAWRGLARFEGRSSLRTWLYTIATNVCLKAIERRPKLVLPVDFGPATDPHEGTAPPLVESVWIEPYPDRAPRPRGGAGRPRGALRAAREHRARLHRGAPAPAGAPARRAHPARRARLLGRRGRRRPRDDARGGLQRAAARAQERRRSGCPSAASRPRCARSAMRRLREIVDAFVAAWERSDVDARGRDARPRRPSSRCRRCRPGTAAATRSAASCAARRWRPGCAGAWCGPRASGQPAFGFYLWSEAERAFVAHGVIVLALDGDADRRAHGLPGAGGLPPLRPARRVERVGGRPWAVRSTPGRAPRRG